MRLFLCLLLVACSGGDPAKDDSADAADADTDTDSDTDADTDADTDSDTDADTDADADPLVDCGGLPFTGACRAVSSGYEVCSDYFGLYTEAIVRPQCEAAGGTFSLVPCAIPDYGGTCRFYNAALPDYCYATHVPTAAADFWSTACPNAAGEWISGG